MKDLACSRVVARSRSTKKVLVKDSPFQRPRIRTSPAARSKTTFTTGLLLWAGQFVSQACRASVPVKESQLPHLLDQRLQRFDSHVLDFCREIRLERTPRLPQGYTKANLNDRYSTSDWLRK